MKILKMTDTFESLWATFGKNASCRASLYKRYDELKRSWKTLKEYPCADRPVSAVTPENVSGVEYQSERILELRTGRYKTS